MCYQHATPHLPVRDEVQDALVGLQESFLVLGRHFVDGEGLAVEDAALLAHLHSDNDAS